MSKTIFILLASIFVNISEFIKPVLADQQTVSCRPVDAQGNNLPYSTGDYTLRCDMLMMMQKDCEAFDPAKMYYRPYCLNAVRTEPVKR